MSDLSFMTHLVEMPNSWSGDNPLECHMNIFNHSVETWPVLDANGIVGEDLFP